MSGGGGGELWRLWVYLTGTPLIGLTITLGAYLAAYRLHVLSGGRPWVNPVLIAVAFVAAALLATGTPYPTYFDGAQFVHFLLGPATVALAVPLHRQLGALRRSAAALTAGLLAGCLTAIGSAVGIAWALGGSADVVRSIGPKSVTAPIAMGIAEQVGGLPSLTAVFVIITGILGAVFGPALLNVVRISDWRARGLAIGGAAHGIGTARAISVDETAGAFAGLGMVLNGIATAVLLPLLFRLL
jgi:predicted murein hydrolase (TIGR00659 family)